jgi:serine/threonine protein kinase
MAVLDDTNTMVLETADLNTSAAPVSSAPQTAGERFDCSLASLSRKSQERYELIRSIGFGGMKCVLLVHDRDTGRDIAMAMMPDFKDRSPADHELFIREARITASLNHPNIVAVHDMGLDENGAPFYTMAYLRGLPLTTVLKRIRENRPWESSYYTLDRRLRIFQRVCNAVNYAHSLNICHLDIKPDNVNIGEFGEVRLFDWGLACETDVRGRALLKGSRLKGSPGYMSPEQISTNKAAPPVSKSSDIFALGALLYALLGLTPPFSGKNSEETLYKTMTENPPKLSLVAPKGSYIPPELEAICRKAMAKDPAERFASVAEMRLEVMNFQSRSYLNSFMRQQKSHQLSGIILILFIVIALLIFYVKNF